MLPSDPENISPPQLKKRRTSRISVLNEEFDLSLVLLIAQKKWKLLLTISLLALTGSIIYLRYAQRVYRERCVIQISSHNRANKVFGNNMSELYQTGEDDGAEAIELMRSRVFLEKVFKFLPFAISYYNEGTFKNYEQYLTSPYKVELDSVAENNLKKFRVYLEFNTVSSGRLAFNQAVGSKNSISFQNAQWCATPFGKIKITVISTSEIEKKIGNLTKDADFFLVNDYTDLSQYYTTRILVKVTNYAAKTIEISCDDFNDKKAADIVNAIGDLYTNEVLEKSKQSAENILAFVDTQLDTIYHSIKNTEGLLDSGHKGKNIMSFQEIREAAGSHLSNIEDKIFTIENNQSILKDVEKQVSKANDIDPMKLLIQLDGFDAGGGQLKENVDRMRQLINGRDVALNDITPDNKTIIEINKQISHQKELIIECLNVLDDKLENTKKELLAKKDEIYGQELNPDNGVVGGSVGYLRLQRQLSIDEKYYDDLLNKKAEYAISKAGFVAETQILDNAIPSWIPVAPNKTLTVIVALLIATAINIILLIFIYLFYNNITSVEEIERLIDSPVSLLGIIPKYTKQIPTSQIIVNHNPKSILAESFRSIRTNLQFIASDTEAKVIAITSTISGEGKTFVAINLAGIIAYSGKKVIILDLDMRRPRIHTAFGMENSKGMSTLLIGKYSVEDVIQKSDTENLDIITAGPIPPNPSELVIGNAMDEVLKKLKTLYDIIIVDNPPVGLVTDGIAMLERSDYPIYLMRVDYSKREFIYFIDKLYYENKFHKLSIILNGVDVNRHKYGYSYYKYGYYGYGYGYTYGHGNYYET